MAYCLIVENPDQDQEQGEQVLAHVRGTGPVPPEGARLMLAGPADPGWRVISVWDSHKAREQFFVLSRTRDKTNYPEVRIIPRLGAESGSRRTLRLAKLGIIRALRGRRAACRAGDSVRVWCEVGRFDRALAA